MAANECIIKGFLIAQILNHNRASTYKKKGSSTVHTTKKAAIHECGRFVQENGMDPWQGCQMANCVFSCKRPNILYFFNMHSCIFGSPVPTCICVSLAERNKARRAKSFLEMIRLLLLFLILLLILQLGPCTFRISHMHLVKDKIKKTSPFMPTKLIYKTQFAT